MVGERVSLLLFGHFGGWPLLSCATRRGERVGGSRNFIDGPPPALWFGLSATHPRISQSGRSSRHCGAPALRMPRMLRAMGDAETLPSSASENPSFEEH